ncbi:MAG: hypothetical protein RDU25_02990 [Patescibacteria group bacterium]|nr:hypothetical protein [Patescibacteria group bacterium]
MNKTVIILLSLATLAAGCSSRQASPAPTVIPEKDRIYPAPAAAPQQEPVIPPEASNIPRPQ